jgi:hypothetical protein
MSRTKECFNRGQYGPGLSVFSTPITCPGHKLFFGLLGRIDCGYIPAKP